MAYLLDTNICIDYLRRRGTGALRRRLQIVDPNEMALCSIVVAELLAGCYLASDEAKAFDEVAALRRLFKSLPFDDAAAETSAKINAELAAQGTPVGLNDLFISAIALAGGLTLVPHNTAEFERIAGLKLEDWQAETRS